MSVTIYVGRQELRDGVNWSVPVYPAPVSWEMNVSNSNFYRLMREIGLEFEDYCGRLDPGDIVARCEAYLATLKMIPEMDAGTPTNVYKGNGRATIVDCGLRAGYFGDRVSQLLELARVAVEKDYVLVYS